MKLPLISLTLILSLAFFSCKKNELGGSSTISGKVMHHSKAIPGARVFIKFDAQEFPGADTSLYDAKTSADAEGNYSFSCYKGEYYVYASGKDPAVPPPSIVVGGAPAKLRKNENLKVDLAVTEGD